MSDELEHGFDQRLLVLAPTGRDGALTCRLLEGAGLECLVCADMAELCARVSEGAAGLLIAQEVITPASLSGLGQVLSRQESWSDLPVVVFTASEAGVAVRAPSLPQMQLLGNVTLLDRPLRPITMVSAARAALRARRRQYMARAELLERQAAVRQRDQFLAMLGHELRNPLSSISMATQLMDRSPRSETRCREIVRRETARLSRLVDDLLDVSRVTAGKIDLQLAAVDVGELLRRCLQSIAVDLPSQRVDVRFHAPRAPVTVHGDPIRLEQVMTNLLNNAVKYTPAGGRVDVSVTAEDGEAVTRIADTGCGISPEMLPRVFELFAQAEETLDRAKGGMGIGLMLVRTLTELHHGRVEVASAGVGKGSTFTMRLPLHTAAASGVAVGDAGAAAAQPAAPGQDILLVEDNVDSREILQELLEQSGHRVHSVGDGIVAIEQALVLRPRVLVIDIGLPGLDGYGVARQIRERLGADVYLIALTGYGQPEDRRRALDAGFDVHMTKPVDLVEFQRLLRHAEADPTVH